MSNAAPQYQAPCGYWHSWGICDGSHTPLRQPDQQQNEDLLRALDAANQRIAAGWDVTEQAEEDGSWSIVSNALPGLVVAGATREEAWAEWPEVVEAWASTANEDRVTAERRLAALREALLKLDRWEVHRDGIFADAIWLNDALGVVDAMHRVRPASSVRHPGERGAAGKGHAGTGRYAEGLHDADRGGRDTHRAVEGRPMTPEQRAAIEARLATATLPWTKAGPNIRIKGKGASVWIDMDPGDEAFIRNAPTDIAALLADNAALRAALEGLLRATEFPVMTIEGQVKATHGTVELARLEPLLPAAAAARAALAEQPDREGT